MGTIGIIVTINKLWKEGEREREREREREDFVSGQTNVISSSSMFSSFEIHIE